MSHQDVFTVNTTLYYLEFAASSRLSYLLGGVQQDQYSGDPLFAQLNSGVQGDRAYCSHHLHHPGSSHDLQGPGPTLRVHYFLWCTTRSVFKLIDKLFDFKSSICTCTFTMYHVYICTSISPERDTTRVKMNHSTSCEKTISIIGMF